MVIQRTRVGRGKVLDDGAATSTWRRGTFRNDV
jgi:hypothetical protein